MGPCSGLSKTGAANRKEIIYPSPARSSCEARSEWRAVHTRESKQNPSLPTLLFPHNILIGKLKKSGLDEWAVGWIENCLSGRSQRIVTSNTE